MDIIEAGQKIRYFERRVMWRKRWLAAQDRLSAALIFGGLLSAAAILYVRIRAVEVPIWAIAASVFAAIAAFLGARWYLTRARAREAALLIDEALDLEDRLSSAATIIERGGPKREVESALLDDAAGRISGKKVSDVLPYRMPQWYGLAAVGLIALAVTIFIPQKSLPGGEALAQERAGIEMAGEELEQAAREVEEVAPAGTETATLAKEQAELGRALRGSNDTRADALKKLSALGERIEQRHEELASTRADEIVSLAEKRLSSALAAMPKPSSKSDRKALEQLAAEAGQEKSPVADAPASGDAREKESKAPVKAQPNAQPKSQTKEAAKKEAAKEPESGALAQNERRDSQPGANAGGREESKPGQEAGKAPGNQKSDQKPDQKPNQKPDQKPDQKPSQKQSPDSEQKSGGQQAGQGQQSADQKSPATDPSAAQENPSADSKDQSKGEPNAGAEQKESGLFPTLSNLPNAVTNAVTEQAAKALPSISEQLLKKAEQLRAGELKPEDIRQLRQAAEFLARDLSQIAQSKELLQAVEQMARQINPEQIEQVARQLLSQEKVRKELEAAARLLSQNRQIKEFVAGLERDLEKMERPNLSGDRARNDGEEGGSDAAGGERQGRNRGGTGNREPRGKGESPGESLKGQGREARVSGAAERKPGGEYLFLQTKPGTGAVRVPYSSAYPQYRRQAERSVERSNVPPHMRSVVRSYFDAINPDSKKP